jgi:hypothetical protein
MDNVSSCWVIDTWNRFLCHSIYGFDNFFEIPAFPAVSSQPVSLINLIPARIHQFSKGNKHCGARPRQANFSIFRLL